MISGHFSAFGRWLVPAATVSIALLAGVTTALATSYVTGKLVRAPDQPLGGARASQACLSTIQAELANGSINYPGAEVEPMVAVDPTNANHLVAAFQQDRWNDGGSNGLITVVSTNGGSSWSLASGQPAFSICEGAAPGSAGYLQRATDPWVSFSPNGVAYQVSDSFNATGSGFGGASSILVSRSTDGGTSWGAPISVELDTATTVLNDKESVTADPHDSNRAYVVWDRLTVPNSHANPDAFLFTFAFRGPAMFSSTSDGGQTWSSGRVIFDPGQEDQTIGNQIVVEPDGTLVDGFLLINNFSPPSVPLFSVALLRSTDHGATWSGPITASNLVDAPVSINGQAVRTGDILPAFAVDPTTGVLYAAWQDGRFSSDGHAQIAFSESKDEGLHWTSPVRINQTPNAAPAFTPQVHVASDGTLGVSYYDLRNATPYNPSGTSAGTTNYFMVHCTAATADCTNASNWTSENLLDNRSGFDMTTAPNAGGFFVGDYEGLSNIGTTFAPFFILAQPEATKGATDPFSNTVSP
jgi:hypothetical protein